MNLFSYVDLFAGCGGLSLGIERSGGELRFALEKSDMAARTFYANFIGDLHSDEDWSGHLRLSPVEQARKGVVVKPLREFLDDQVAMQAMGDGIDVVVGGPPCQGFSLAGRRNQDDVRNKLPWEFLEFVEHAAPKVVVIENVVGMMHRFSREEEPPFVQLQQALATTGPGYEVQGVAVNALHYCAPQDRPRLMIIGLRRDLADASGVRSTGTLWRSSFSDEVVSPVPPLAPTPSITRSMSPTVGDAIGDLQTAFPHEVTPRARAFQRQMRSRTLWGLKRPTNASLNVPNQEPRSHTPSTRTRFRLYQWLRDVGLSPRTISVLSKDPEANRSEVLRALSGVSFPAIAPDGTELAESAESMLALMEELSTRKHSQKALAWDKPARTVVTLPDDYVHPSEPRIFTVRELARFQGFPDDFVFVGKETTGSTRRRFEVPQYSQVGNAVSPLLGFAVGSMVNGLLERARTLAERPVELQVSELSA